MRKLGLAYALLAAAALLMGCESGGKTGSMESRANIMNCSGCGKSLDAGDVALRCSCGATKQAGDIKCRCPKCQHENRAEKCVMKCPGCGKELDGSKMHSSGGSITCTCGKTITCSDVVCACPKCGGAMTCDTKCDKCCKEMTCTDKCMACAKK